jgi:mRNA-degrading endonuclease RelE of RelBE toxin-antitoxin system
MIYEVKIKRQIEKGLDKLPILVQKKLVRLVMDLRDKGPVQPDWPNYSKLSSL